MVEQALPFEPKSQCEMLMAHFRAGGTLTVLEAIYEPFRCYALSQRCGGLRRAGHDIQSEWVKLPSGKRIKRYYITQK